MVEKIFMTCAVVVLTGAWLLNLFLISVGMWMIDRMIFPFLRKEKAEWFLLWGGWHLFVLVVMFTYFGDEFNRALDALERGDFQTDVFLEAAAWVVWPLMPSFMLSMVHYLARERLAKNP